MTEQDWIMMQVKLAASLKSGTLTMLAYAHDDWCPTLRSQNGADCRCDPDVEVIEGAKQIIQAITKKR